MHLDKYRKSCYDSIIAMYARHFSKSWAYMIQVERTWDLVRDSGQRKLTYSSQNHCTSSRSVYLSRRLNSHWERFVITHHLQKWESQLRLRWICFWATPASKNFALYQFGSTKNAVLTKLSIQHFLFIWYIPSKLHTEPVSFRHHSISHFWFKEVRFTKFDLRLSARSH